MSEQKTTPEARVCHKRLPVPVSLLGRTDIERKPSPKAELFGCLIGNKYTIEHISPTEGVESTLASEQRSIFRRSLQKGPESALVACKEATSLSFFFATFRLNLNVLDIDA